MKTAHKRVCSITLLAVFLAALLLDSHHPTVGGSSPTTLVGLIAVVLMTLIAFLPQRD